MKLTILRDQYMFLTKYIFFIIFIVISIQVPASELKDLSDYLKYAALNNQELKAAFYKWQSAVFKINRVRGLPDPKFTYTQFIENVETRVGPQKRKFGLMQKLPWFGKLGLKEDMAKEGAKALQLDFKLKKLKLFYKIKSLYGEYYYTSKAIQTTKHNMELVKYFESVARTKYKAGRAPHSSIIRSQVEFGKLENKLKSLQEFKAPLVAKINAALNRPQTEPIAWPKTIPKNKIVLKDADLFKALLDNNPQLQSMNHKISKEKFSIALSKKNYFPDFTFGINYIETDDSMMVTKDSGKDPLALSVSINIPMWFSKYNGGVQESVNRHQWIVNKKAQRANNLRAELQMSIYKFKDSQRKINLYRHTLIPKSKQSLGVTQQSFEAGKVNFLSLIDAQRALIEFELLYHKALAQRFKHFAYIEMLVGKTL
ncbi:MAG: TolC family protein [Bacteriovoracaceae bacterium]|nr:TolC family protein [Bacteriovoracaceae bacterium]